FHQGRPRKAGFANPCDACRPPEIRRGKTPTDPRRLPRRDPRRRRRGKSPAARPRESDQRVADQRWGRAVEKILHVDRPGHPPADSRRPQGRYAFCRSRRAARRRASGRADPRTKSPAREMAASGTGSEAGGREHETITRYFAGAGVAIGFITWLLA